MAEWEWEQAVDGVPFGACRLEWESLKSQMLPGDEIWFWSSESEDSQRRGGWEGMALVRGGEIVASFITAIY